MSIHKVLFLLFCGLFASRSDLILENPALRHQMTVQQRTIKRPKLKNKDRIFWSWLSQIWPDWKSNLIRQMSQENLAWGAPRIQSELKLLGYVVADSTVAKYMITPKKPHML